MNRIKYLFTAIIVLAILAGCGKKVDVALSVTNVSFAPEGATVEVTLTSNGDWSVDAYPQWLTVNPTSGKGDATLTLTAPANDSDELRSGEVRVTTKDNATSLTVTQEARPVISDFIVVSPEAIEADENGGTFELSVTSNCEWTVSHAAEWIHCNPASGNENGTVTVNIDPIEGDISIREADIIFSGVENTMVPIHVIQHAPESVYISVTPIMIPFDYTGGTENVAVHCNGNWTVSYEAEWITLSDLSGSGDAEITVIVAENPIAFEPRVAEIQFHTETGESAFLTIKQEGAPDPHFLEVNPTAFSFSQEGGAAEINISCDMEWEANLQSDWASLSSMAGNGNSTITLTVTANTIATERSLEFRIISGFISRTLTVSQEAGDEPMTFDFEPDTIYSSYNGGFQHVELMSNTTWELEASDGWISMYPTSGEGDASFDVLVDLNVSPEPRTGYLNVLHNGQLMGRLVVVQEGKPNIFETDITVLEVHSTGGEFTIQLTANQSWILNYDVDWLSCTPTSGNNSSTITVVVEPSDSPRPRTGNIKIVGSTEAMIIVTVNQHD